MNRPLKIPTIKKGDANSEGLTWEEWRAAVLRKPIHMGELADWGLAWRNGEDPTNYTNPPGH